MVTAAPHRERRSNTELCSLVTATALEEMAWSCDRGKVAGGKGKVLHQRAVDMEQLLKAVGPKLPELKECLDTTLTHRVDFGCFCVKTGVGLSDPYGSLATCYVLCFYGFMVLGMLHLCLVLGSNVNNSLICCSTEESLCWLKSVNRHLKMGFKKKRNIFHFIMPSVRLFLF